MGRTFHSISGRWWLSGKKVRHLFVANWKAICALSKAFEQRQREGWSCYTAVKRHCNCVYEIWDLSDPKIYYIRFELDPWHTSNCHLSWTHLELHSHGNFAPKIHSVLNFHWGSLDQMTTSLSYVLDCLCRDTPLDSTIFWALKYLRQIPHNTLLIVIWQLELWQKKHERRYWSHKIWSKYHMGVHYEDKTHT